MSWQMKRLSRVVLLVVLLSVLPGCVSGETAQTATSLEPVVIQLKWTHQFQFAGYYAALEQDFFKDEGLDVTLVAGGPGVNVDDEVLSGRATYGVLASELIKKWQDGKPVVLIAPIIQHSIRALMVREDSHIFSPHDLIGKRVVVTINEDPEIKTMFLNEGVFLDQVKFEAQNKDSEAKFLSAEIDSVVGSIANQPYQFKLKGVAVRTIRPINYGVDFYGDSLFTSQTEAKERPQRVEAVLRAVSRGWGYAFEHQPETIALIRSQYAPEKTTKQLAFEAQTLYSLTLPDLVEIGHNNPERWQRIADTYAKAGLMKPVDSLNGFFYVPQSMFDYTWLRWLGGGLGGALVILAGVLVWNAQLRQMVNVRTSALEQQFEELQQTEQALRQSESLLHRSQEQADLGSFVWDLRNNALSWSRNMFAIHGLDEDKFEGNLTAVSNQLIHPADRARVQAEIEKMVSARRVSLMEFRIIRSDGAERIMQSNGEFEFDPQGQPVKCIGIHRDITERKQAEEQIKQALREKETLLRELYHRTKNNMGVICALLELQSSFFNDEGVLNAFTETKNRIHSMALVHQKLYQAQDLSRLNLKEYVDDLVALLVASYRVSTYKVAIVLEMEDVFVLIDTAIPCGLILNELISNAFKHAFPNNIEGEIKLQLCRTESGDIQLEVADNGMGVPEGFDFRNDGRLGLQNIFVIGEVQLRGKVAFRVDKGVACRIQFRDDQYQPRV